ncbi:hypothetical protein SLE2022_322420 [Rubroshorea leprosula]
MCAAADSKNFLVTSLVRSFWIARNTDVLKSAMKRRAHPARQGVPTGVGVEKRKRRETAVTRISNVRILVQMFLDVENMCAREDVILEIVGSVHSRGRRRRGMRPCVKRIEGRNEGVF